MITRTNAFAGLDAAIGHELALIFPEPTYPGTTVGRILENRDKIVDILTTTQTRKTRADKANGRTRKRKAAAAALELLGTQ